MPQEENLEQHELAVINAFVMPKRRDRLRFLAANPKRRKQFLQELAHFKSLDSRCVISIPPQQQNPPNLAQLLKLRGAGNDCFVLSEDSRLDRKRLPLLAALEEVVGYGKGTFISCIPGKLAYFEDEDQRWLLENK